VHASAQPERIAAQHPGGWCAHKGSTTSLATGLVAARRWGAPAGLQLRSRLCAQRMAHPLGNRGRGRRNRRVRARRPTHLPAETGSGQGPACTQSCFARRRRVRNDRRPETLARHGGLPCGSAGRRPALSARWRARATAVPKAHAASPRSPGAATWKPGARLEVARRCTTSPATNHARHEGRRTQRLIARRRQDRGHEEPRSSDPSRDGRSAARRPTHRQDKGIGGVPRRRRSSTGKQSRRVGRRRWPWGAHIGATV
jgi:hypothetical protein